MACCSSETFTVVDYGTCGDSKPVNLNLTRGLNQGMVLNVIATTNNRTQFDIKDCHGNILLHVCPRIDQNVVVFNYYKHQLGFGHGRWGPEERSSQMPIKCGIKYCLLIAAESKGYRIFLNGEEFHFFKHHIHFHNPATVFEIHDGHVYSVSYKNNEPKWAVQQAISGLYVQEFGCGKDTPHDIHLQGCNTLSWVQITGIVNCNASRISFNLLKCTGENVFHFNPRFDENCVVRNSALSNWGTEERGGGMPFQQNQRFTLAIVVEPHCYRTYVNGEEFITYNHRAPANSVTKLNINEKIKLFKIIYHK